MRILISIELKILNIAIGVGDILAVPLREYLAAVLHNEHHVLELSIGVVLGDDGHAIGPQVQACAALVVGHYGLDCEHVARHHYVLLLRDVCVRACLRMWYTIGGM